jgi:M6 family metalloprotease-like protein
VVARWNGSAWRQVGMRPAFRPYDSRRGGLYFFRGPVSFASAPPATAATPDEFGFNTLRFARTSDTRVRLNVLLMLTTYSDTSFEPDQTQEFYEEKFFGTSRSLEGYFNDNSHHLTFEINHVGTVRVEDPRPMPCAHRWSSCPGGPPDSQPAWMATVEQLESLPGEAVAGLDRFDLDENGVLSNDELFVLKVEGMRDLSPPTYPFDDNGGLRRDLPRCAVLQEAPSGSRQQICGRYLPVADETNFITAAHEFAHLFGADDLYGDNQHSSTYSLMGSTIIDLEMYFHLDPWHKMRMGMVTPRIIPIPDGATSRQSVRLTLPFNNADYEPVLFYDPERGLQEYFMIEFRKNRASSYDYDVLVSGLVIWYVKTDGSFVPVDLTTIDSSFNRGGAVITVAPPDQVLGPPRAWTSANGDIQLRWPGGGDTGLRLRVGAFEPTATFLAVEWWTQ